MRTKPVPQELIQFIRMHTKFSILSHVDPDGDCIASSLALGSALLRMGKQVELFNPGPFIRREILKYQHKFSSIAEHIDPKSAVILIDCAHPDRIGKFADRIQMLPKAIIDHHKGNDSYGDVRFINSTAPSASLLVQQVLYALGIDLSYEEAEYIFFAFATDTGFFQFLNENNEETFKLVAELSKAGVSPRDIKNKLSYSVSLKSRQYLGKLLGRSRSFLNGAFICTWSKYEEIQEYSNNDRDSAAVYQQLLQVQGVHIVLVLWEKQKHRISGNIRTSDTIDASIIAKKFGGGGHERASGFEVESTIEQIITDFTQEVSNFL